MAPEALGTGEVMARFTHICRTCGEKYTEKTKKGHARMFGHTSFTRIVPAKGKR